MTQFSMVQYTLGSYTSGNLSCLLERWKVSEANKAKQRSNFASLYSKWTEFLRKAILNEYTIHSIMNALPTVS